MGFPLLLILERLLLQTMLCLKAEVMDGCQQRVYGIDLFGELAESDECCVCAMFVLSRFVMFHSLLFVFAPFLIGPSCWQIHMSTGAILTLLTLWNRL